MKKLLFLILLFPLALFSQTKIVLKGTQVTISSLANIAGLSVVANATGSPATPTAVLLGVGLTFSGGKLAIDTANFKDSIYALNGLSILGVGFNRIGLGGFLSQNTTISGSNLYSFSLDSMQAGTGRGFRVNFLNDAGWDIPVRDSATGFWTRVGKGTVGQGLIMLPGGGIGWGTVSGGSDVTTNITNGTSSTVPDGISIIRFNSTGILTYTLTLPTNWNANNDLVIVFTSNGTITNGNPMVNLTIVNGSGHTLSYSVNPNRTYNAGESLHFHLISTIEQCYN